MSFLSEAYENLKLLAHSQTDSVNAFIDLIEDAKAKNLTQVKFPPGDYLLKEANSIPLYSDTIYIMEGIRFICRQNPDELFYVFKSNNPKNISIIGGEVIGNPDWSKHNLEEFSRDTQAYINIGGILISGGETENVSIQGFFAQDLTAAGILIISKDEKSICKVRIEDCQILRASPNYADYLTEKPAGALACFDWDTRANIFIKNVIDVEIANSKAIDSHCDGITLENCQYAKLINCEAVDQHMGGIVLIGGQDIVVKECNAIGNGSRGFTIEAGCTKTELSHCLAIGNGREGCWIDRGCQNIKISDVEFVENGRKSDLISTATYPGNKTSNIRITKGHSNENNMDIEVKDCRFSTYNQLCSFEVEENSLDCGPIIIKHCDFILLKQSELTSYPYREKVDFVCHIYADSKDVKLIDNKGV